MNTNISKGDIFYADFTLDHTVGSEQSGDRPVLIIQNNMGNTYSPTVIVALITSEEKACLPIHLDINLEGRKSTVLLEQLRTIDKRRLRGYLKHLDTKTMQKVDDKLKISLGIM